MIEDTIVVRPPSEARSFLLPVTVGCSHNKCTFCGTFYPFTFRTIDIAEIKAYIDAVARNYSRSVRRVFLENGDALAAPYPVLKEVLLYLKEKFPAIERVGTYASPASVLNKTDEELKDLRASGLTIAYLGVETGDPEILKQVRKGATYEQIVEAGRRLKRAGIVTSVTVILGLGGAEQSERHAVNTGKILTDIDPDYAGALTLMLVPGTPLHKDWQEGRFKLISPMQSLVELKLIIENSDFTDCFFTANHASNYLPIRARLPQQKAELVRHIQEVIDSDDPSMLKPEYFRAM